MTAPHSSRACPAPGASAWITTASELEGFAARLRGCGAIALDSESDSLHHHFAKVCLIQVATDRGEARLWQR